MIRRLHIQNYAVIDHLDIEFGSGLNVLTGETGAGKSIIVEAINAALGERVDGESIRSGCDRAVVDLVLEVTGSPRFMEALQKAGVTLEDGCIIISREMNNTGRSNCRINGRPVTVSMLKEITDELVDIHGQHEHQYLLRPDRHLEVIDAWCGQEAISMRESLAGAYSNVCRLRAELEELLKDEHERESTNELYRFQIAEILGARLSSSREEEELFQDRERLANAERLASAASRAFEKLGDRSGEVCALDLLDEVLAVLQEAGRIDCRLNPLVESLESALYQLEDVARELRAYRDAVEINPQRLHEIEERLDAIQRLKRKYGNTIEDILAYATELQARLEVFENSEGRVAELQSNIEQLDMEAISFAERLHEIRKSGVDKLVSSVEKELSSLGMQSAVFGVRWERKPLDITGIDDIEFLFSANIGEPPKPLAKIASGGEMSRVMLAVKSVMAELKGPPIMIFDEIDVGVGGRTADVIACKLVTLAQKRQVLCITHLPQIASRATKHFSIEKQQTCERTVVQVKLITGEERIAEIARMLGGIEPSATAVEHAKEMLEIQ